MQPRIDPKHALFIYSLIEANFNSLQDFVKSIQFRESERLRGVGREREKQDEK